jgi:TetR/AcrR family transcriptional repressor of nem operon
MRKGQQTRQEIIRKAAPIFNQRGFDGATLSDLMRATGLEKGGIYRHFASKEQLAGEAFDYSWHLALDTRFQGTQKIPNSVDRLKQIVWNFRDRCAGLVAGGCPLLNMATDSDDGNPVLRNKARQAFESWVGRLRSVVEEGQRRGEIRSEIRPVKLSTLIVSTLEGGLMLRRLQRTEVPIDIACRHLEEYLETKIRAKDSKARAVRT